MVITTDYPLPEMEQELLWSGLVISLQKPFVPGQIARVVHEALDGA